MHIPLLSAVQNSVFYKVRMSLRSYTCHVCVCVWGGGSKGLYFSACVCSIKTIDIISMGVPLFAECCIVSSALATWWSQKSLNTCTMITARHATLIHMLASFVYFDNDNIMAAARSILVWHPMNHFNLTCQICTVNSQTQLMSEKCALLGC